MRGLLAPAVVAVNLFQLVIFMLPAIQNIEIVLCMSHLSSWEFWSGIHMGLCRL